MVDFLARTVIIMSTDGYGLASIKREGCAMHPRDIRPNPKWSREEYDEWYTKQLKAYEEDIKKC